MKALAQRAWIFTYCLLKTIVIEWVLPPLMGAAFFGWLTDSIQVFFMLFLFSLFGQFFWRRR